MKINGHEDYSLVDVNNPEYEGTSNSLHCPVLVVKKNELLQNQCFHIKVDNFIGSSIKEIFGKNIFILVINCFISYVMLHVLYKLNVFLRNH